MLAQAIPALIRPTWAIVPPARPQWHLPYSVTKLPPWCCLHSPPSLYFQLYSHSFFHISNIFPILSISIQGQVNEILYLLIPLCFRAHNTFHSIVFACDSSDLELEGIEHVSFIFLFPTTLVQNISEWIYQQFVRGVTWVLEELQGQNKVPSQVYLTWRWETIGREFQ